MACWKLSGKAPAVPLQVRYRQGGEMLELPGRGRRDLKRLLNEYGVPGFVRGRLPLLYQGEQLLAVPNLTGLGRYRGMAGIYIGCRQTAIKV